MRLTLLGVRGSTASPGPEFVRYGGHTSCVAVAASPDADPTLVLDAGTGLRTLTGMLAGRPFTGSMLLSHLHWDHVQGIPFFAAGDRPDARVELFLPQQGQRSGEQLLAQQMAPPAFPITPAGLLGSWDFTAIAPGRFQTAGFDVTAASLEHKGGVTFGYRLDRDGASVAYLPDHAPKVAVSEALLEMLTGVDVLIHDAQFLDHERPRAESYGHSTVQDSIALAERVGAARLVLFHHAPNRTDDALDAIASQFGRSGGPGLQVMVAAQCDSIDV